jgi:hypothetical protein
MDDDRQPEIPYLSALRAELVRAAIRSNRLRARQVRAARAGLLALALGAAAAGLALLGANGSTTPSANASVLRAVRSAVTPPARTILHEETINTLGNLRWRYEFWQRSDAPQDARVIKGGTEASFNGSVVDTYNPSTNTIQERSTQETTPEDPVVKVRALLDNGDAQIVGTTTLEGRRVFEIRAHSSDDMLFNGTIYVDRQSYEPVLAEVEQRGYDCGQSTPCAGLEQIRFLAYEYLPQTPESMRLLSTIAQHPSAHVIGASSGSDTSTGQTQTTPSAKNGSK